VIWSTSTKGDPRCRTLADRHYTRQTPGHPQWTRPGYSAVLYAQAERGEALFVWWRPKWEDGRPGTARKDGLRCLECTHFRREGAAAGIPGALPIASELIRAAVVALDLPAVRAALHLDAAGPITDGLISGVGSAPTSARRGRFSVPGECFARSGWTRLAKAGGRADVWYTLPWSPA
jgi:hypothetical protein